MYGKISASILTACTLLTGLPLARGAEVEAKPEKGETLLDEQGQKPVLEKIRETFAKFPCVRAKVVRNVEDPLGLMPTQEHGELLVKRPDKILRRYLKDGKSVKAVLIKDQQSLTYNASSKQVLEKDYSKAPKRLQLVRAGSTGDLDTLQKYYGIKVFEADGEKVKQWRLVLDLKAGDLPYKQLQARIAEGQPLFSEVKYVYNNEADGDNSTETYSDIKIEKEVADEKFEDDLFKGAKVIKEVAQELTTD